MLIEILDLFSSVAYAGNNVVTEASQISLTSGSMLSLISEASPMVKAVLLLLTGCSVLSWAIILNKFLKFRKVLVFSKQFSREFWDSHSLNELNQKVKKMKPSPLLDIFKNGYLELIRITQLQNKQEDGFNREFTGITNIKRSMSKAKLAAKIDLERDIPILATIATASPFIGLFGTVWGIVNAFQKIGLTGSASLTTVAPGVAEALIATALGLIAAIPAVIFYNLFVNKLKIIYNQMETFSSDLLNIIERHFFFEK